MKYCLLSLGDTGAQVAEALAWAAAAGVLHRPDGLELLAIDTVSDSPLCRRALTAWQRCEELRALLAPLSPAGSWLQTPLHARTWTPALSGTLKERTRRLPAEELLARTLFTPEEAAADPARGLSGYAALGALTFSQIDPEAGALGELLQELRRALEAGERVRLLLCGAAEDGVAAGGGIQLARMLRERLGSSAGFSLGALILLPHEAPEPTPEEDQLPTPLSRARAALRLDSGEVLLRQPGESCGLLDSVLLLGMPADCLTPPQQPRPAHLLHWIAALCADRFFGGLAQGGCAVYQLPEACLSWDSFAPDQAAFRRGYGGLLRAAACYLTALSPTLRQRLPRARWSDHAPGWYGACFRRMDEALREAQLHRAEDVEEFFAGFLRWMGEIDATLPTRLLHGRALAQAAQESRENLRRMMEEHARHTLSLRLAEQRIQETQVSRAPDPEGDEALRRPLRAQESRLLALRGRQSELDGRTGGAFRIQTLEELLAAAERGLTRAAAGVDTLTHRLETFEGLPGLDRDPEALARTREQLWKERRRLDIYAARKEWLLQQLSAEERERLGRLQPGFGPEERRMSGELVDREALRAVLALLELPDDAAARKAASEAYPRLLPNAVGVKLSRLTGRLGSVRWRKDAEPMALLIDQLLTQIAQEDEP